MAVDHGVVNSPVTHSSLRELVKSPSPGWPPLISHNVSPIRIRCTPTKGVLYDNEVDVYQDFPVKVCFYFPTKMISF